MEDFPRRFRGRSQSTFGGHNNSTLKDRAFLGKKMDTGGITLKDNPAGHCSVLKNKALTRFFK